MKKQYSIYEGKNLPQYVKEALDIEEAFKYGGQCTHYIINEDDPTDWAAITDNGGFYKVGALYIIWTPECSKAIYSTQSLFKAIELITTSGDLKKYRDPEYAS
jgi:hypothetical protein